MDLSSIGARIKARRIELGLTQIQIREMTGISSGNMSGIENNDKIPSSKAVVKLSEALDCTTDWILKGDSLQKENSNILTDKERELIKRFEELDEHDQDEILGIVCLKIDLKRSINARVTNSFNRNTETEKMIG